MRGRSPATRQRLSSLERSDVLAPLDDVRCGRGHPALAALVVVNERSLRCDLANDAEGCLAVSACDEALRHLVEELRPCAVIGVGAFATARARAALSGLPIATVLHPSPASPAANRDWALLATIQMRELGIWE